MRQLRVNETRSQINSILNQQEVVEFSNGKETSVIIPKEKYKALITENIQLEMELILSRNEKLSSGSAVEKEVMEIIHAKKE